MQIEELVGLVPTSLSDFATASEPSNELDPRSALFRLSCAACSQERFALREILSGEHGAAGVEATCSQCGQTGSIFNASRDGYDGRLGHLRFLEPITARRPLRDESEQEVGNSFVACGVSFSIDPDELSEIAAEEEVVPQDLFDWFVVHVRGSPGDSWRPVWEYECA